MRRGVLMRQILYSGAWNADVWLHSFPMSLADRSFDSDGNCVCVVDSFYGRRLVMAGGDLRQSVGMRWPC